MSASEPQGHASAEYGRLMAYSSLLVILLVAVGAVVYYTLYVLDVVPLSATTAVELVIVGGVGLFAIFVLGREVRAVSTLALGEKHGSAIYALYRFASCIVLALVLLAIAGISGTELLAGGTFAGLVLGLAGQTVLSNFIAGLMIIFARPFEVNDRVTLFTWQYGVIAPAYPPKFYSNDLIMPGYSGEIKEIGMTYTRLRLDDGPTMKVPNNILVQAAVVSQDVQERWVKTKYEVPVSVDPAELMAAVREAVRKNEWVAKPDSVRVSIEEATSSVYVISAEALCKGQYEVPPRSSILLDMMKTVAGMR